MSNVELIDKLIESFEKLSGVGKKTATRYAYNVIEKFSLEDVEKFSNNLINSKKSICRCKKCGILSQKEICDICSSERDISKILVVKDTKDAFAIENTKQYKGLYHVLGGLISPISGVSPKELNFDLLFSRLNVNTEVIVATPFTQDGETTYLYIKNALKNKNISISRIGFGLPAGGDIDYVDDVTLKRALEYRTK